LLKRQKPLKVCSHTGRKKKEFIEEERAQITTLLGSYLLVEPEEAMGKTGDY
jgi:hypothetical protein